MDSAYTRPSTWQNQADNSYFPVASDRFRQEGRVLQSSPEARRRLQQELPALMDSLEELPFDLRRRIRGIAEQVRLNPTQVDLAKLAYAGIYQMRLILEHPAPESTHAAAMRTVRVLSPFVLLSTAEKFTLSRTLRDLIPSAQRGVLTWIPQTFAVIRLEPWRLRELLDDLISSPVAAVRETAGRSLLEANAITEEESRFIAERIRSIFNVGYKTIEVLMESALHDLSDLMRLRHGPESQAECGRFSGMSEFQRETTDSDALMRIIKDCAPEMPAPRHYAYQFLLQNTLRLAKPQTMRQIDKGEPLQSHSSNFLRDLGRAMKSRPATISPLLGSYTQEKLAALVSVLKPPHNQLPEAILISENPPVFPDWTLARTTTFLFERDLHSAMTFIAYRTWDPALKQYADEWLQRSLSDVALPEVAAGQGL